MAKEVATTESKVPALYEAPALDIGADDVALPRFYVGQSGSDQVKSRRVEEGQLFTALGQDDPSPNVLGDEALVHVLSVSKGKSLSQDGELFLFDINDPDAPADAWVTYNYVIALPEDDAEVPFKWLLTRSATPTARIINYLLVRNANAGPPYNLAFSVTTKPESNNKGSWFIPQVVQVDAKKDNVAVAANLATMISHDPASVQATGEEPAI